VSDFDEFTGPAVGMNSMAGGYGGVDEGQYDEEEMRTGYAM
jgi:hypothetical protein